MASHVVSVTEFKANCLALLEDVSAKGDTITVTKRGKPLATVSPAPKPHKTLKGIFQGQLKITDADIRAVRKAMWDPKRLKEKFDL
ncbi:MAG TPA: type II toxin-antitoxin system prevent-host-death family antitoxin [Bryobacteraceae bacterium]|jgi:prevent-host-death family protein|nr:type II toxin-antitoxin system prevent-host-death family antitoxin [Bryobacteraceae bacterium]